MLLSWATRRSMKRCRLYSEAVRSDSSSTRAMAESLPTFTSRRDECEAKFWLDPVRLERSHGFNRKDIKRVQGLVEHHHQHLLESWNEFFHG